MKQAYFLEIEDDLMNYFKEHIDETQPEEVLLVQMLKFLREILKIAEKSNSQQNYPVRFASTPS